ncbi:MAG: DUF5305 family protein [Desulfitobacteriia bacterium]|jgi:hypothetical protein
MGQSGLLKRKSSSLLIFFGVIFLLSLFFTVISWTKPLTIEEKVVINEITQQTQVKFMAEVKPSTLYPQGGLIVPQGCIFPAITKNLRFSVASSINAREPISLAGTQNVTLKLVSLEKWEKEYTLAEEINLSLQEDNSTLIEKDFIVNLGPIQSFIENVEKETLAGGQYQLIITPQVKGEILFKDYKASLQEIPEIILDHNKNYISRHSDNDEFFRLDEPIIIEQVIPIEKIETKPQYLPFFGTAILVETARNYSLIITIFLLMPLAFFLKVRQEYKPLLSEAAKIDKKHKKRLVTVQEKIRTSQAVNMNSFKALLNLADEKDQPILRYEREDGYVEYFIVSEGYFYGYKAEAKVQNKEDQDQKPDIIISSGSGFNV